MSDGGPRVLLIEDEAELRAMIAAMLAADGYRVADFGDAEAAMAHADSLAKAPRLVVTDAGLPGMSGQDLIRTLDGKFPGLAARSLLITGDDIGPELERFSTEVGCGLLGKPFRMDTFLRRCREILRDELR